LTKYLEYIIKVGKEIYIDLEKIKAIIRVVGANVSKGCLRLSRVYKLLLEVYLGVFGYYTATYSSNREGFSV
jgi:hypothetical protein